MKRTLLILVALMLTTSVFSQIRFGIKGGLNANLYGLNFKEVVDQFNLAKGNSSAGFHVGAQLRFQTKIGLYIQGEALYNYSSAKVDIIENGFKDGNIMIKNHVLDIPALVGFKIGFFRIYAGPTFAINLGQDVGKSLSDIRNISFKYDNNVFGYQAGVGFDIIKKITIDLNYNGRFSRNTQTFTIDNIDYEGKLANRQIWLSVGFLF